MLRSSVKDDAAPSSAGGCFWNYSSRIHFRNFKDETDVHVLVPW